MKNVHPRERQLALVFDGKALNDALRDRMPKTGRRKDLPTKAYLSELFKLDRRAGELIRLKSRGSAKAGTVAGYWDGVRRKHPYRRVKLEGVAHYVHHLIYIMAHGEIPLGMEVDHINGDTRDNRPANLRLATRAENARNQALSARNTSGIMGVHQTSGKRYAATLGRKLIGTFDTLAKAKAARIEAMAQAGYHPNHGRAPVALEA